MFCFCALNDRIMKNSYSFFLRAFYINNKNWFILSVFFVFIYFKLKSREIRYYYRLLSTVQVHVLGLNSHLRSIHEHNSRRVNEKKKTGKMSVVRKYKQCSSRSYCNCSSLFLSYLKVVIISNLGQRQKSA